MAILGRAFKDSKGTRIVTRPGSKTTSSIKGKSIQFTFNEESKSFSLQLPDKKIYVTRRNAHVLAIWILDKLSGMGHDNS